MTAQSFGELSKELDHEKCLRYPANRNLSFSLEPPLKTPPAKMPSAQLRDGNTERTVLIL